MRRLGSPRPDDPRSTRPMPPGHGDRQRHARQLLRRRPASARLEAAVDRAPVAWSDEGPTCSTSAASRAARGPSRSPLEEELRRVIPVVERLAARAERPDLDRHDQGRGRPAGARGRGRRSSTTSPRSRAIPRWPASSPSTGRGSSSCTCRARPRPCRTIPATPTSWPRSTTSWPDGSSGARPRGIPRARIAIDPGIGFGKTLEHNLELLRNLERFANLGCAVLVGTSRKGFLGTITGRPRRPSGGGSVVSSLRGLRAGRTGRPGPRRRGDGRRDQGLDRPAEDGSDAHEPAMSRCETESRGRHGELADVAARCRDLAERGQSGLAAAGRRPRRGQERLAARVGRCARRADARRSSRPTPATSPRPRASASARPRSIA